MKIDLHCHSKYSKRPTLWFMQKIGCPESFTDPVELYHTARRRGMDYVTITDHNVIDGALEIAGLPNTLIGCEYTTYFPEDRCKVHVLVYGQTEKQHRELNEVRDNIHHFVQYLHHHGLKHVCAHPLFGPNEKLGVQHVEQLVLLFKNWEWNGDMNPEMNAALSLLLTCLGPQDIAKLVDKHQIQPPFEEPWRKNLTAGSDDHSSLHLAAAYTEVADVDNMTDFWNAVEAGQAKVRGVDASPQTFARNVYGIAWQFYKSKFDVDRWVNKDIFLRFLNRTLQNRDAPPEPWLAKWQLRLIRRFRSVDRAGANQSLMDLLRMEAEKHIGDDPQLMAIVNEGAQVDDDLDRRLFEFANQVSNKALVQFGNRFMDRLLGAHLFELFHSVGAVGSYYGLLAPYFMSFGVFAQERAFSREVLEHFLGHREPALLPKAEPKVAHFTDTLYDVNGVSRTLQQQLRLAQALGKNYSILTCGQGKPHMRGAINFPAVGSVDAPEYPDLKLLWPPFLQMLAHCYEDGHTHLHAATPGPVGLAALAIARILKLPISATYHTSFPQYAKALTDDAYVTELTWKYMVWFYDQMDVIYAPSHAVAQELIDHGISALKICVYPRGIDITRFHPAKRNGVLQEKFGVDDERFNYLYVGRVSREKNLGLLLEAFRLVCKQGVDARLIITGDGPYRAELEKELADEPVLFTGYLEGDDLPAIYAACDAFVFPSTTDTFGNVVLEAQASGLPVIVTNQGGPMENLLPDETGYIIEEGTPEAFGRAMRRLAAEPDERRAMSLAARRYMEGRGFEQAFETLWSLYTRGSGRAGKIETVDKQFDRLWEKMVTARAVGN